MNFSFKDLFGMDDSPEVLISCYGIVGTENPIKNSKFKDIIFHDDDLFLNTATCIVYSYEVKIGRAHV